MERISDFISHVYKGGLSSILAEPLRNVKNLLATDGVSFLYAFHPGDLTLHRKNLQQNSASPDKLESFQIPWESASNVSRIEVSRNGRFLALVAARAAWVVDLPASFQGMGPKSKGASVFPLGRPDIPISQLSWHPLSDCHVAMLSPDGAFRLFNCSLSCAIPEQEFFLTHQTEPHNVCKTPSLPSAAAITAATPGRSPCHMQTREQQRIFSQWVGFGFGGPHLWERFTVFFLASNGSLFTLCPVVPFGGFVHASTVEETRRDAHQSLQEARDAAAAQPHAPPSSAYRNALLSLSWLDAVFPSSCDADGASDGDRRGAYGEGGDSGPAAAAPPSSGVLSALPFAHPSSQLLLQGPLPILPRKGVSSASSADSAALFCSLSVSVAGRDTVVAAAAADGTIHVHCSVGEVSPAWAERTELSSHKGRGGNRLLAIDREEQTGRMIRFRMITSTHSDEQPELSGSTGFSGPPLVLLGVVDLDLPPSSSPSTVRISNPPASSSASPLDLLLCHHPLGLDVLRLSCLPFSSSSASSTSSCLPHPVLRLEPIWSENWGVAGALGGGGKGAGAARPPSALLGFSVVESVEESYSETLHPQALVVMAFDDGSHLQCPLALRSECVEPNASASAGSVLPPAPSPPGLSPEVLAGPVAAGKPQAASPASLSLPSSSVEGRALLHSLSQQLYGQHIAFCHKAYAEIRSELVRLQTKVKEQAAEAARLRSIAAIESEASDRIKERLAHLLMSQQDLRERLSRVRSNAPAGEEENGGRVSDVGNAGAQTSRLPLSIAEQEFGTELDSLLGAEMPLLKCSISELARSHAPSRVQPSSPPPTFPAPNGQMSAAAAATPQRNGRDVPTPDSPHTANEPREAGRTTPSWHSDAGSPTNFRDGFPGGMSPPSSTAAIPSTGASTQGLLPLVSRRSESPSAAQLVRMPPPLTPTQMRRLQQGVDRLSGLSQHLVECVRLCEQKVAQLELQGLG